MTPPTYPQFIVPSYTASLLLPPRPQPAAKPPLPPRHNNRPTTANSIAAPSRLTNTFASLFGGSTYAKSPNPAVSISPPGSLHRVDSAQESHAPIEVSTFTIDRTIVRKGIGRAMNKILKMELKAALNASASLGHIRTPSWVVEQVQDMTATWYPFIKGPSSAPLKKQDSEKETTSFGYFVNPAAENPDNAAGRLQDFYLCLAQDTRVGGISALSERREKDVGLEVEDEKKKERDKREHEMMENETRIRDNMEAVERTIISLFYDRLFMQPTTDDTSHDEALSSRVAALNLLDLGLGHLGIEISEAIIEEELDVVVKACGEMLAGLDFCQSPADKGRILVAAHKIVVDALSRLPPICLRSENEATYNEDFDNGPQTAKPTIVPAELEVNAATLQSAQRQVSTLSETIPETFTSAIPPMPLIVNSPQPDLLPPPESNTPSSRLKNVPLPLHLSIVPSPGVSSPKLHSTSLPKEPMPVSGNVLLPLIVFSVVKCNPPHLVSNLLFTQRFRNRSFGGEESYCLINLMAVAEFLENVDMAGLGLGDSEKVMSTADLTPIPLTRTHVAEETPLPADGGLRGRVGQQVDAIADSANTVISGVVDSSFGILRSFMPSSALPTPVGIKPSPGTEAEHTKPGFNLLRRESGFSIASIAASLPIKGRARSTSGEEMGQQLIPVSRPSSLRSKSSWQIRQDGDESQDDDESDDESESAATGDGESDDAGYGAAEAVSGAGDAKSIRSFENMLNAGKEQREKKKMVRPRRSISDRLASVSAVAVSKTSPTSSPRTSLLLQSAQAPNLGLRLAPPKQRFMECTPDDLRLSEVGELLWEYRRLVEGIRAVGGFDV